MTTTSTGRFIKSAMGMACALAILAGATGSAEAAAKPKPKAGTLATVVMTIVVEEVYPIARKVVVSQAKQLIRGVTCTGKSGTANSTPQSCKTN